MVKANIGDCHAVGGKPITFIRQVCVKKEQFYIVSPKHNIIYNFTAKGTVTAYVIKKGNILMGYGSILFIVLEHFHRQTFSG